MPDINQPIHANLIGKYCIVRTYSAGVFAGTLLSMDGKQAMVGTARRMWRWAGAASLSQLANNGTSQPNDCKFPATVPEVLLTEVIEIIPCSTNAQDSISAVKEWTV